MHESGAIHISTRTEEVESLFYGVFDDEKEACQRKAQVLAMQTAPTKLDN
jgi:hypothetical protein